MPVLIDATVLTNLACVQRLDLLAILETPVYIASTVYEEIQSGLEEGYEFLASIDVALSSGQLSLVTLETEQEWHTYSRVPAKLHRGEAMSLAVACCRGWQILTDDRAARAHASYLNVSYSGTLGILVGAVREGCLTLQEGNTLLTQMIARARYRSPVTNLQELFE